MLKELALWYLLLRCSNLLSQVIIMNTKNLITIVLFFFFATGLMAQHSAVGTWITKDDETGEEKSYVEIYESNGQYFGKVTQLLLKDPSTVCKECKGAKKDQLVTGMVIIEGMKDKGKYLSGGTILDPTNGKTYKCKITAEENNTLKVRGYIGIEALGRNQVWRRKI